MRLKGLLLLLLGVVLTYGSSAQKPAELTQSRILILLDGSSSMTQPWLSGKLKFRAATDIILRLMDSVYAVNKDVEFSLRVFGHQYPVADNNCYDTRNEVPFHKDNRLQMEYRLDAIKPLGVTSIAYSLKQAAANDLLDPDHNAYSIVLITDGGESCGGNICEVMRMLISKKVYFRPYIVSLEDYPALKQEYDCMGDYLQVTKDGDINKAVTTIVDAFRPALKITTTEYKELQTIAAKAPSILKVNVPVIKDTVPAPKPEVKPTPATWAKPANEAIDKLFVKGRPLTARDVVPQRMQLLTGIPGMPEIEIERAPNESIGRITYAGPRRFNVPAISTVAPPLVSRVPAIPETEPEPQPIVPEKIAAITTARNRNFNIPTRPFATLNGVDLPAMPVIEPEVVRPDPERITSLRTNAPQKVTTTQHPAAMLIPVSYTVTLPDVVPEVMAPTPEAITRIATGKAISIAKPSRSTPTLNTVTLPSIPEATPEVTLPAPETVSKISLARITSLLKTTRAIPVLTSVNVPALPAMEVEALRPSPESIGRVSSSRSNTLPVEMRDAPVIRTVRLPLLPDVPAPEVERPAAERIGTVSAAKLRAVNTHAPEVTSMKSLKDLPAMPEIVVEAPPAPPRVPEASLAKLPPTRLRSFLKLWVLEDPKYTMRHPPALPPVKVDPPPPAPAVTKAPAGKPGTTPKLPEPTAKKVDFTVATEDAQETSLQIFFTDGHGKYYPSTPQMLMLDPSTQNIVKKFYRNVDANGNPDAMPGVTPGTYDITLSLSREMIAFNVKIEPNKKNTLTMRVPPASLSFEYAEPGTNRSSSRPVKEFQAMVIERNKAQGKVKMQKGTEALEYEPGNYHIDLNTFPEDSRNIDLDFGHKVITIYQPGFAKFTDQMNARSVTLWKRDGDRFAKFYTLDLSNPIAQNLQMQPGEYQVHYQKGPATLPGSEKVKPFIVRSVQNTEIIID